MNIQLPEPTFDTTTYTLLRKPDNTIVRVFGNGFEEPELTQEQHQYNVDYHTQVASNAQAQLDKVAAFEVDNPPIEREEPEYQPEDTVNEPQ